MPERGAEQSSGSMISIEAHRHPRARHQPDGGRVRAHEIDVQTMGQRDGHHRCAGLLTLGQNPRLEFGAVHAPVRSGLHRCPPVRIGGHHRHERFSDVQDGAAGRSLLRSAYGRKL